MIFWPDLARTTLYSKEMLTYFDKTSLPKNFNPPNIAQGHPIEDFSGVLVQLIYEHEWQAKQLQHRIRKIPKKKSTLHFYGEC